MPLTLRPKMPLRGSGVAGTQVQAAGHRTEPQTRGGRTGLRKKIGDNQTRLVDEGDAVEL